MSKIDMRLETLRTNCHRFWPAGVDESRISFMLVEPYNECKSSLSHFDSDEFNFYEQSGKFHMIWTPKGAFSAYGTGEVSGSLLRNNKTIRCWNSDAVGYDRTSKSLYQSHPWVMLVFEDGTTEGVFSDTAAGVDIEITDNSVKFICDELCNLVWIQADSPLSCNEELAELTGKIKMPPLWALGFHQCRWSYTPDSRVKEVATELRQRAIPCDAIWMDIDYMDGFRIFTFDKNTFPDPKSLNQWLHEHDYHSVWMIDPGVKKESGYFVYDQLMQGDFAVKDSQGKSYCGEVWPGECVFPDFTREDVRLWWGTLYEDFLAQGVDGVWNDMNEPSVFNEETKTMSLACMHQGDGVIPCANHGTLHNLFGMQMVRATSDGIHKINPEKRQFVLTRSGLLGYQRYAATWTGDNTSNWEHLADSITMCLSLSLSGQPFSGPDIGGFAGEADESLFARWIGLGAFLPFSRAHTEITTKPHEPYAFGEYVEEVSRRAVSIRYRLLPYLYHFFYKASELGHPVMRPLFYINPKDPCIRNVEESFLLGDSLMVCASVVPENVRLSCMPKTLWPLIRSFKGGDEKDADIPDLRIKPGSVIPVLPDVIQSTVHYKVNDLILLVCPDESGKATGTLYEDDGHSYAYKQGAHALNSIYVTVDGENAKVSVEQISGKNKTSLESVRVILVEPEGERELVVSSFLKS